MDHRLNLFWLEQAKIVNWNKKPKKALIEKKGHYPEWFSDGKINIYDNCILNNIKNGLSNKIALRTVNYKKEIKEYTYKEIDILVNNFCSYFTIF